MEHAQTHSADSYADVTYHTRALSVIHVSIFSSLGIMVTCMYYQQVHISFRCFRTKNIQKRVLLYQDVPPVTPSVYFSGSFSIQFLKKTLFMYAYDWLIICVLRRIHGQSSSHVTAATL